MEQVVINLSVNARDAMPRGGSIEIETRLLEASDPSLAGRDWVERERYGELVVRDSGEGIPPEAVEHIFEPFFTTKEEGRGTGLGLSTVFGIVKQSSGYIEVRSGVGEGTTIKIYFPPAAEATEDLEGPPVALTAMRGTETILLVEDEEIVRALATRVLSDLGYSVLEAADGGEALEMCQNHEGPIDLVITDVVMPGMSGTLLALELEAQIPGTPVLFISGYTGGALVEHGVLDEELTFLQKPFSRERLARVVRELLDHP
jgi:CheY-like chemotaxis protein